MLAEPDITIFPAPNKVAPLIVLMFVQLTRSGCFALSAACKSSWSDRVPTISHRAGAHAREPHTTVRTALPSIAPVKVIVTLFASTITNVSGTIAASVASKTANTKSVVLRL